MRKLILDFGNTLQKAAVFENNQLISIDILDKPETGTLEKWFSENGTFDSSILSSVIEHPQDIHELLLSKTRFIELDEFTHLPFINHYQSPETLGKDRIAAVAGAIAQFPGKDVLVVDAGTAITFDIVTGGKDYFGGAISPGIDIRFRALHTFTGKLPLVEGLTQPDLIGRTTEGTILSGVLNGVFAEFSGIVERYRLTYPELIVILTGGDHKYFDNKLKNNIFALPNLVLEGLNLILEFNEGK